MNNKLKLVIAVLVLGACFAGYKWYDAYVNYRFMEITEGKVYKSGVIPPDEIDEFVKEYNIKSVVDLRGPVTADKINNPENWKEIRAEQAAVSNIEGLRYFNIPSEQVPKQHNLNAFYKVIDNPDNYPILIHCYHGIGRAQVYSAVYRIEKENWSNEDARSGAAFPLIFSSFDNGTPKGEFLKSYVARRDSVSYSKAGFPE